MNTRWGIFVRAGIFIGLVLFMGMSDFKDGLFRSARAASGQEMASSALATAGDQAEQTTITDNLKKLWKTFGFPLMQAYAINKIALNDPNNITQAAVYQNYKPLIPGKSLEGSFIAAREPKIKIALEKVLGASIPLSALPRIACSCSGGGYRAMILTTGFMYALEDMEMRDTLMYATALSGGTFCIGPWTFMQPTGSEGNVFTIAAFAQRLRDKIKNGMFSPKAWTWSYKAQKEYVQKMSNDCIFPKVTFEQPISLVDVTGSAFAEVLLADFGAERQRQRLSSQWFHLKNGAAPWPLYTAVSWTKDSKTSIGGYNWYEFSPEEVRNIEKNLAIPAFAFGRTFENGTSKNFLDQKIGALYAPEQSFGFLMGIFGSAFAFTAEDVKRISELTPPTPAQENELKEIGDLSNKGFFTKIWDSVKRKLDLGQMQELVTKQVINGLVEGQYGKTRIGAAQICNPFKGYQGATEWLQDRDYITFIDAGLHYNIPLLPLFRPDRKVNLILVCDASSDAQNVNEFKKGLDDVKRLYHISYKKDASMSDENMLVMRPEQPHEPIVVYFNFYPTTQMLAEYGKNPALAALIKEYELNTFDMEKCVSDAACNTYNFAYTQKDFNQLMNLARLVVRAHESTLRQLLIEVVHHTEEDLGFGN